MLQAKGPGFKTKGKGVGVGDRMPQVLGAILCVWGSQALRPWALDWVLGAAPWLSRAVLHGWVSMA